jgi:hypothetical protein
LHVESTIVFHQVKINNHHANCSIITLVTEVYGSLYRPIILERQGNVVLKHNTVRMILSSILAKLADRITQKVDF